MNITFRTVVNRVRTSSYALPVPSLCPLLPLETLCTSLIRTAAPGLLQHVERYSQGNGTSNKAGKDGVAQEKIQTSYEIQREIEAIEKKRWTVDELKKEVEKAGNLVDFLVTEKAKQLEDIENQLATKRYRFDAKEHKLLSNEEKTLLTKLYNLNAKAVKKRVSNFELKTELDHLKGIVKEHKMRENFLNEYINNLQKLKTRGLEVTCAELEKVDYKYRELISNGEKKIKLSDDKNKLKNELIKPDSVGNVKNNTELEIHRLKDELKDLKQLMLKRLEYYNKTIIERSTYLQKIKSYNDILLEFQAKGKIEEAKHTVESDLVNNINEETKIQKELGEEKEKLKKVHTELEVLKKKSEEFHMLCENYNKKPN